MPLKKLHLPVHNVCDKDDKRGRG